MSQSKVLKKYNSLGSKDVLDIRMNAAGDELRFIKRGPNFKLAQDRLKLKSLKLSVPNTPAGRQALLLTLDELKPQIGARKYNSALKEYDNLVSSLVESRSPKAESAKGRKVASPKGRKAASPKGRQPAAKPLSQLDELVQNIPWGMREGPVETEDYDDDEPQPVWEEVWQTKIRIPAGYKFLILLNENSLLPEYEWDEVYPGQTILIQDLTGVVTIRQIFDRLHQELNHPIDPKKVNISDFYQSFGDIQNSWTRKDMVDLFERRKLTPVDYYYDHVYFEGFSVDTKNKLIRISTGS